MEVQEEVMGSSMDQACVLKGKRTKRRPMSPFLTMATTSYSSGEGSGSGGAGYGDSAHNFSGVDRLTTSPSSNSGEFTQSTVDEEDMANCLILLAQGHSQKSPETVLAVSNNKVAATGTEVYQCKTCNRCFPSFQALGGHRASHKKPKIAQEEKKPVVLGQHQESVQFNEDNTILSLQIPTRDRISSPTNKSRVHECSICGAEFNSGQALGGHMRRHRPMPTVATGSHEASQEAKKPRTLLSLDLNLPAPEDDHHREPKFPFASKEQVMVFSASPLVDCHY